VKTSGDYQTQTLISWRPRSTCGIYPEAYGKLSIQANNLVDLKHEQEKTLNCLLERRDVLAVVATGYGKHFIFLLFRFVCNCSNDQESAQRATFRYYSVSDLPADQYNSRPESWKENHLP